MEQAIEEYAHPKASFIKKFFSLWIISYVWIYILFSQFSPLPAYAPIEQIVVWFGKTLFHLPDLHKIRMTGSGDTAFDYVLVLFDLVLAFLLSVIIVIADRNRRNYRKAYLFTIVVARYYVAYTMLVYGFVKLFHGQFGSLSYYSLDQTYGDKSPMAVLWNFMQYSYPYSFFGGLMEVAGGVLLLFRKTKTIGALLSMAVMINVAMMNFAYDVPVKLFSGHIVLLCIFILSYDWLKLYNFFIAHKTEVLNFNKRWVKKKWMRVALIVIKSLVIVGMFYLYFLMPLFRMGNNKDTPPLEGAYTTQSFVIGDSLTAVNNDSLRWEKLYVDYPGYWVLVRQGNRAWYASTVDTSAHTVQLKEEAKDTLSYASFHYELQGDTSLLLRGNIKSDTSIIRLSRKQKKDYPLIQRGFHWINPYPYNR